MAIFKNCQLSDFAMIPNKLSGDENLSWKAKGVLTYLLSKPSTWKVHTTEIVNHATDGIKSLNSAIKELIEAGYIVRTVIRGEKGYYEGYEYNVYASPTGTPLRENR